MKAIAKLPGDTRAQVARVIKTVINHVHVNKKQVWSM
jgi:hypothetical protein